MLIIKTLIPIIVIRSAPQSEACTRRTGVIRTAARNPIKWVAALPRVLHSEMKVSVSIQTRCIHLFRQCLCPHKTSSLYFKSLYYNIISFSKPCVIILYYFHYFVKGFSKTDISIFPIFIIDTRNKECYASTKQVQP